MFNISDYLERFKTIQIEKTQFKDFVVELIKKELNFDLDRDNVDLKKGIVYLKISPIQKNELFIKKQFLLGEFNKNFPNLPIRDIR